MRMQMGLAFGAVVGYVLGARAGTQRYEEMKGAAGRLSTKLQYVAMRQLGRAEETTSRDETNMGRLAGVSWTEANPRDIARESAARSSVNGSIGL